MLPLKSTLANSMSVIVMDGDEFGDMNTQIMTIATATHMAIFMFLAVCFILGCGRGGCGRGGGGGGGGGMPPLP
jgi:hypothetical protein